MKAVSARISGGVSVGALVRCDDNSGAKLLRMIAKQGDRGRRKRIACAGVGDIFFGSVVQGKTDMLKKIVRAVVIRQKKEYRRASGERVWFEDNACVLLNEKNEPQASEIKGVVAKEVAERFAKVAAIAKNIV